jgi:hypothetical protein
MDAISVCVLHELSRAWGVCARGLASLLWVATPDEKRREDASHPLKLRETEQDFLPNSRSFAPFAGNTFPLIREIRSWYFKLKKL